MTFSSLKRVIAAKAKKTEKKIDFVPFFRKGNYLPVLKESQYKVDKFSIGTVPKDISGTYLKNGPNPVIDDPKSHWFDGDGMIHAFNFKDGELFYCNRWTQTERCKFTQKTGKRFMLNLGDARGFAVLQQPLEQLEIKTGYRSVPPNMMRNTANTAMTVHQKRFYALLEADYPF